MKITHCLLLATLVLGASSCAKQQMPLPPSPKWVDFYSASARHGANFPERPKVSLKEDVTPEGVKAYTYLQEVRIDSQYFGTGWVPLAVVPADKAGRDRLYDVAMNAAVKSIPGGVVMATYRPQIGGIEGRMYTIDIPSEKMRMRQQIYVAGTGLVEQTYTGPAGSETDGAAERFFASLFLLP